MAGASLEFIGYALLVAVIFNLSRSVLWRQYILLIASFLFLSFFSHNPVAWLPLAVFLAFGFIGLRLLQRGLKRSAFFVPLVILTLALFVWLKKYTFIPSGAFLSFPYITLGLSYIFFRVLHLLIDARDGNIPETVSLLSYLNYTLNFSTVISGPIQRSQDFLAMQLAPVPPPLDLVIIGEALERIIIGFFKVNVLSLIFSMVQNQTISTLDAGETFPNRLLDGIIIAALYPFYLYCNFSGYIDIVIGIGRLLRIELPENFNRPFSSENFLTFWSRWHITLSEWLKTYVYNPLLITLMRKYPSHSAEPFFGVFAFFVTFFLIGVWHGQTSVFLFFGVLQGLGVSTVKLYQILMVKCFGRKRYRALSADPLYNLFARGLTFTWFAFTLLWFWSNWGQLHIFVDRLRLDAIALVWCVVFVGASLILAAWESVRAWLLSFELGSQPLLLSRYVRTVWGTALLVIAVAAVTLLNAPAPDIVYKAF